MISATNNTATLQTAIFQPTTEHANADGFGRTDCPKYRVNVVRQVGPALSDTQISCFLGRFGQFSRPG